MKLNPFKESNLEMLQEEIACFLLFYFYSLSNYLTGMFNHMIKHGNDRITIMIVPHTEKKIINFHLPLYSIALILLFMICGLFLTSVEIINHSYVNKDVSNLEKYDINSKIQIRIYNNEINGVFNRFNNLKPELSSLYLLLMHDSADTLWAKGGDSETAFKNLDMLPTPPSIEELDINEFSQELKVTAEALKQIRKSLKGKKIITNLPSILPVNGKIVTFHSSKSDYISMDKGFYVAAYPGAKIIAPATGNIENITWDKFYGISITIRHKYGFSSVLSHCQDVTVRKNQNVLKGDIIGHVGKTGSIEKYACFYQIKIGSEYIDPIPFLK